MAHDGGARAADVLHERDAGVRHLIRARALRELQERFDDLVAAARADRMAARFEAAERRERQLAAQADAIRVGVVEPRAGPREAGRFERQRGHDRVGVVRLEEIDVAVVDAGLLHRLVRRARHGRQVERIGAPRERERRGRERRARDSYAAAAR